MKHLRESMRKIYVRRFIGRKSKCVLLPLDKSQFQTSIDVATILFECYRNETHFELTAVIQIEFTETQRNEIGNETSASDTAEHLRRKEI